MLASNLAVRRKGNPMRHRTIAGLLSLALVTLACVGAGPAQAGGSIVARTVVGNLNGPAGFTFLKDGRIVYLERGTGQIHIYNPATKTNHRFFTIPGVNGEGERGALGVAVSPDWPSPRSLYVYVTRSSGGNLRNQIVKVTRANHTVTMQVLMSQPASSSPYHNGGRILFGPDGMLYAIVGDGHDSSNAQDLSGNLRGKILRMTPDGGAPADNPIAGSRIFAFGIRNSFGFTFDPQTDSSVGDRERTRVQRRAEPDRRRRQLRLGTERELPGNVPDDTNGSGPTPRISRSSGSTARSASRATRSARTVGWAIRCKGNCSSAT